MRRQVDLSSPTPEVRLVYFPDPLQMLAQRAFEPGREQGATVPQPFPVAHHDLVVAKVDVFHAQAEAFQKAQPAAIEKFCH